MAQDVILLPGEHGLAGPSLMIFTKSQPEGRVYTKKIGIVTIFITGSYLVDPLTNDLD